MKTILAFAMLLSSSGSCWFVNDDKCEGGSIPVLGTPADYHTAAGERPALTLHAPCGNQTFYLDGHFIAMEGKGGTLWDFRNDLDGGVTPHTTIDREVFRAEVTAALSQRGIDAVGGFGAACDAEAPACAYLYFAIRDWKLADAAVEVVMDKIAKWQIGECVGVLVSGEVVLCPM